MRPERRVDLGKIRDSLPDNPELRQRGRVAVIERGVRVGAEPLQLVGAAQHAARRLELLVLAGAKLRARDFCHLKFEQIEPRGFFALVHVKRVQLELQLFPRAERGAHVGACCRKARELIEHEEVALRIEQRLVFVLPVQLDERRGRIAERRGGDERVVEKRSTASLRIDVASNDQCWADLQVGDIELRLNLRV